MKRSDFDNWFPSGSMLRDLALRIATLSGRNPPGFLTGPKAEWPDNFLANAELGAAWHKTPTYSLSDVASWKSGYLPAALCSEEMHGFELNQALSRRGLALLFDPLVDGFLAAHVRASGHVPSGCTVIVLSDYFTFSGLELPPTLSGDWGLNATLNTLAGIVKSDHTTTNLFNCLFENGNWEGNESGIVGGIVSKKVLLWNFLPMFRGGASATLGGVPTPGDWQIECWSFLSDFLAAVGATTVVLACSKDHLDFPRSSAQLPGTSITLSGLGSLPTLPACVIDLWRLNHPYSWGLGKCPDECPILGRII